MKSETAPELRSAVRFPIKLQASIDAGEMGKVQGETRDISSGGVLFYVAADMQVGSAIEFSLDLPAEVLGTDHPVAVRCVGRVVRCTDEGERRAVAAVIDEYKFERT